MIGMSFASFLTLLILGLIAAICIHVIIGYRMFSGVDGFFAKWIGGWIGAWLGGPVLGHWWFQIQAVYIIPALVGAFVGAFAWVALAKAMSRVSPVEAAKPSAVTAQTLELKKAS
jgi:uncharacterized membrane protein YeaQ/YmgE (transglycosylase-associated protein family)